MIRPCAHDDFQVIEAVINEAAQAYRGAIPADCWHEPYITGSALKAEIDAGVKFWGWDESNTLIGSWECSMFVKSLSYGTLTCERLIKAEESVGRCSRS